ncbi:MAG TPA: FAD-dependent oxidoreductase [Chitinispirillaceae bacterium]|nr:FAD-dependent oxidoreductase [Chitinispirillaceae bacterium]
MQKKKVVIIGAGFAGLASVQYLCRYSHIADVVVVDRYENSHFRPLIPDIVSGRVKAQNLLYPILPLRERLGFTFYCEPVREIDFNTNVITMLESKIKYDYLIFTAGSQTTIPPTDTFRHYALRLDSVHDASHVRNDIINRKYECIVVCGGGYTGIELSANLQQLIRNSGICAKVIIVEMVDKLVSTLPGWMSSYITQNLASQGIQICLSSKVKDLTESSVQLSNGEKFENALCIWTTGLESSTLARTLDVKKDRKGRIDVDQMLHFKENCFAAGDAVCFNVKNECARMSVQCSLDQGRLAAQNVISQISGMPLKKYVHRDPGFIVPLSNAKACGEVFGIPVKGMQAVFLHYLLSTYRSKGIYNRLAVLKAALKAF